MRTTPPSRASYNEALGLTVNQLLFEHRMTRKDLGAEFGVGQSVVSRKLRGQVSWTAEELSILASLFAVSLDDVVPTRTEDGAWIPAAYVPGQQKTPAPVGAGVPTADAALVAGAGFEPATSGLHAWLRALAERLVCSLECLEIAAFYRWRFHSRLAFKRSARVRPVLVPQR